MCLQISTTILECNFNIFFLTIKLLYSIRVYLPKIKAQLNKFNDAKLFLSYTNRQIKLF